MSKYDDVKGMVRAMAHMRTGKERDACASEIIALVQAMEAERPAAPDAIRTSYESGFLAAMELLRETQRDLDGPLRKATYNGEIPNASGAIDALRHYADTVVTQFEIRATKALRPPKKEAR